MEDEENFKYLQIPIVELLATIAEHQPSLLEIFLDLEDKDKESGEKKIGKQSCLPFVLDLIETRFILSRENPESTNCTLYSPMGTNWSILQTENSGLTDLHFSENSLVLELLCPKLR